jgi:hypothetical protein
MNQGKAAKGRALPQCTWNAAEQRHLATARAFTALGIPASTIRSWASHGLLHAVAKAPGGAHLYRIRDVLERHKLSTRPETLETSATTPDT